MILQMCLIWKKFDEAQTDFSALTKGVDPQTLERDGSGNPNDEVPGIDLPGGMFFFLLYAAWVRSRAERPSVSYTKVVMEVAWTGHNLQFTKTN